MELHQPPASDSAGETQSTIRYNAKLGMTFFLIYMAIYSAFVLLCTFKLDTMSQPWIGGVNLAIWYGFGLIAGAFILASAFLMLCKK